jgi:hypothetical protein
MTGTRLKALLIAFGLDIIGRGFALKVERTGKHPVAVDTALHGSLHGFPHGLQVVPDGRIFTFGHVFPVGTAVVVAPMLDVYEMGEVVNIIAHR